MDTGERVEHCIDAALQVGRDAYGITLDFSDESVKTISDILDGYHERYLHPEQDGGMIKERPNTFAHMFGAYVGEVLRRGHAGDFTWQESEYGLVLAKDEKTLMNPIGKAYKHIVNGREDGENIKSFFDVAVLAAQGKFPPAK